VDPSCQQRFNVIAIPTLMGAAARAGGSATGRWGAAASLRAWVEEILGN
jgi:hypothetical protein